MNTLHDYTMMAGQFVYHCRVVSAEVANDTVDALQAKLDAAEARISELEGELQYFVDRVDSGTARSKITYARFKCTLDKTPAQSLAKVQADAVRDATKAMGYFRGMSHTIDPEELIDYAKSFENKPS